MAKKAVVSSHCVAETMQEMQISRLKKISFVAQFVLPMKHDK